MCLTMRSEQMRIALRSLRMPCMALQVLASVLGLSFNQNDSCEQACTTFIEESYRPRGWAVHTHCHRPTLEPNLTRNKYDYENLQRLIHRYV